jgi:hypothetical protein
MTVGVFVVLWAAGGWTIMAATPAEFAARRLDRL